MNIRKEYAMKLLKMKVLLLSGSMLCFLWSCSVSPLSEKSQSLSFTAVKATASGKFLGNIWGGSSEPLNFSTYWNQVTPENAGKWGSVESSQGTYNWSALDAQYSYAKSRGYPFKFHNLIWGSQQPAWISTLSAANQVLAVIDWISNVGARYSNLDFIDVVNEPLHSPPSYSNAMGGSGSTGWDWIVFAFQQARKYCGNAKLLINEYGVEGNTTAMANYTNIISILKASNLIDGVGVQGHDFSLDGCSLSTLSNCLSMIAATGLPIYISELDLSSTDDTVQLGLYQKYFPALWENPDVMGVTLWGYIQGSIWTSNAFLLYTNGTERPALTWLTNYVRGGASSAGGSIQVFFYNGNTSTSVNSLSLNFLISNTGLSIINLTNVTLRYYYTIDSATNQIFNCNYSTLGNSSVTGSFVTMPNPGPTADRYVQIGFTSAAGSLYAGNSAVVQVAVNKSDWSSYIQTNDYSFNSSAATYTSWSKVTGYISGTLAFGTEPSSGSSSSISSVSSSLSSSLSSSVISSSSSRSAASSSVSSSLSSSKSSSSVSSPASSSSRSSVASSISSSVAVSSSLSSVASSAAVSSSLAASSVASSVASSAASSAASSTSGGYAVNYTVNNDWGAGATCTVTIKNNSAAAVNGWTLVWTFAGNQTLTQIWNATDTQSGATVTVKNASFNNIIGASGGTQSFGFNLSYSGSNVKPAAFTLNGTACTLY